MCVEESNAKKEKDIASFSKEDCLGKVFAVNIHCVFVSIVKAMQIKSIEVLDLPITILQMFILL